MTDAARRQSGRAPPPRAAGRAPPPRRREAPRTRGGRRPSRRRSYASVSRGMLQPVTIDPGAGIGHVHLKVADLDRALGFWQDVLGFEVTQRLDDHAAFLSAGGYHHHIGLNTWESRGRAAARAVRRASTTSRSATRRGRPSRRPCGTLSRRAYRSTGLPTTASPRRSTCADSDGNGVELCWDRPREEWPYEPDGSVGLITAPLDLGSLFAELE